MGWIWFLLNLVVRCQTSLDKNSNHWRFKFPGWLCQRCEGCLHYWMLPDCFPCHGPGCTSHRWYGETFQNVSLSLSLSLTHSLTLLLWLPRQFCYLFFITLHNPACGHVTCYLHLFFSLAHPSHPPAASTVRTSPTARLPSLRRL